jgi:lysyl endopeptidase
VEGPSGQESQYLWRAQIRSPGALSINLGFTQYFMPPGGALHIYTPDRSEIVRPFTSEDNEEHGQLWTPILSGDTAIVEV